MMFDQYGKRYDYQLIDKYNILIKELKVVLEKRKREQEKNN